MTIRELREKSLKIANEARALLDTFSTENSAEKSVEFDKMMAESDELATRATKLENIEARNREFAEVATPVRDSDVRSTDNRGETADANFTRYLRGELSGRELRALGVNDNAKGGFTVPKTFSDKVISSLQSRGPMLDPSVVNYLATDGGNPIFFPIFNDTAKAVIVGENTQIGQDDLSFGQAQLGAYKYTSKIVLVSRELLEDSAVDVAQLVSNAVAERIARGVNEHLTIGTGTNQPQGIVTAATVGKTTAATAGIAADELIDLQHSIDPAYRGTARFMVNDTVVSAVRKLKDSTGAYIWQAGMSQGVPETILGRPFIVNPDMPAIATGAKSVLFGDFSTYTVRQARGIEVRRLDERYADSDQVAFVALARLDGLLLDMGAVRALKQA